MADHTAPTSPVQLHSTGRSYRPWWPWLLTAFAFPPSGYVAYLIVGHIDSVWTALAGGLITGAGLGAAQWALLRLRGIKTNWIGATAVSLAVGLAVGAAVVSYRTDLASLALMGAISGLAVGLAQGVLLGGLKRGLLWTLLTAALWTLGWTITTVAGISVEDQFTVFGISGAAAFAILQTLVIDFFVPSKAKAV